MKQCYRWQARGWLGILLLLLGAIPPAQAQYLGVNIDGAFSYSAADTPISGGSLGLTHPLTLFPKPGLSGFSFQKFQKGQDSFDLLTRVKVSTADAFYHVPIPVSFLTLTLGGGLGTLQASSKVITEAGRVETITVRHPVNQIFGRVGIPFFYNLGAHVGVHYFIMSDTPVLKNARTPVTGLSDKANFSGMLMTVGIDMGFALFGKKPTFDPSKLAVPALPAVPGIPSLPAAPAAGNAPAAGAKPAAK